MSRTGAVETSNTGSSVDTTSVGRVVYSIPFLVFGGMHFFQGGALAAVVPSWLPGSLFWVYLTGAANLAAGISIAVDRYVRVTAIALVGLLATFIVTVHLPGVFAEGAASQMAVNSLLKDVGLAGGAMMLFGQRD